MNTCNMFVEHVQNHVIYTASKIKQKRSTRLPEKKTERHDLSNTQHNKGG